MRFHLLGSLEVIEDDELVELGGGVQRAVLGYLLLHVNQVVPTSRILRALWDEHAPLTARKMVQNAVSGIRRTLAGSDAKLHTHSPGYRLEVAPDAVDMHQFRLLVEEGRTAIEADAPVRGVNLLRSALRLWRGRALADLVE